MTIKRRFYVLLFFLLLGLVACGKPSPVSERPQELLAIKVGATGVVDALAFNSELANAIVAGEAWPKEPVMLVKNL